MRKSAILVAVVALLAFAPPVSAITNGEPDAGRHPYVGLAVFDVDGAPSHRAAPRCCRRLWYSRPGTALSAPMLPASGSMRSSRATRSIRSAAPRPTMARTYTIPTSATPAAAAYRDSPSRHRDHRPLRARPDISRQHVRDFLTWVSSTRWPTRPIDFTGYGVNQRFTGGGPPVSAARGSGSSPPANCSRPTRPLRLGDQVHVEPGQGKGGTCFGDSGGPDLLAGTDTVIAVNSYVTNSNCGGIGYSSRINRPETLHWIATFL